MTIAEFIGAADYLKAYGCKDIILCERGIKTFETATRNTLDLACVPIIHQTTDYKIIVDPSHGTGVRYLVKPMSIAALAAGAEGIMVEVHPNPKEALSDGPQSLHFNEFEELMESIKKFNY